MDDDNNWGNKKDIYYVIVRSVLDHLNNFVSNVLVQTQAVT